MLEKKIKTSFPFKNSSVFMHARHEWWDQYCTDMKTRNWADIDQNRPVQNIIQNNDEAVLESQITEAEIWYANSKLKSDRFGA